METMTTAKAIDAVVTLNTLPPQIDYKLPYLRKASAAQKWIELRPWGVREQILSEIRRRTNAYYDSRAAYYDSLF
jgi:hypothetical protein